VGQNFSVSFCKSQGVEEEGLGSKPPSGRDKRVWSCWKQGLDISQYFYKTDAFYAYLDVKFFFKITF